MHEKSVFGKAKQVIADPHGFFHETKTERGIAKALKYFVALTFIILIITTYEYVKNLNAMLSTLSFGLGFQSWAVIEITPALYISVFVALLVTTTLFAFARYYFIHIFVWLFNKEARYEDTYKALGYSIAPGYLGAPFLVGSALLFPSIGNPLALIAFISSTLIYLACEVYSFYVRSKGLSILQGISFAKAALCIYVLGLAALLLAALVLELIFVLLMMLTLSAL